MTKKERKAKVLFQKLGATWYAFSEVNNDVIYSALPEGVDPINTELEVYEVIEAHLKKVAEHDKRSPSST